jgi:hypothetical protein
VSIVATEIVSDSSVGTGRWVIYRCQDDTGAWHKWGPVWAENGWDADAFKPIIAERMATRLAEIEAEQVIGSN